jgi:hypothetical protein
MALGRFFSVFPRAALTFDPGPSGHGRATTTARKTVSYVTDLHAIDHCGRPEFTDFSQSHCWNISFNAIVLMIMRCVSPNFTQPPHQCPLLLLLLLQIL